MKQCFANKINGKFQSSTDILLWRDAEKSTLLIIIKKAFLSTQFYNFSVVKHNWKRMTSFILVGPRKTITSVSNMCAKVLPFLALILVFSETSTCFWKRTITGWVFSGCFTGPKIGSQVYAHMKIDWTEQPTPFRPMKTIRSGQISPALLVTYFDDKLDATFDCGGNKEF